MSSIHYIFSFVRARLSGGTRLLLLANLVGYRSPALQVLPLPTREPLTRPAMELSLCKAWLEARKDGYSAGYGDWLLGYLTGVNLWGPTGGRDLLRDRNAQEMIEWVDKYCTVFPKENIELAARQLILDLGRRAKESTLHRGHEARCYEAESRLRLPMDLNFHMPSQRPAPREGGPRQEEQRRPGARPQGGLPRYPPRPQEGGPQAVGVFRCTRRLKPFSVMLPHSSMPRGGTRKTAAPVQD